MAGGVVVFADEFVPIHDVQFLAGAQLFLARGAGEAVDVEELLPSTTNQLFLGD